MPSFLPILIWVLFAVFPKHPVQKTTSEVAVLNLRWNSSGPQDSLNNALIGLEWALSYCGARTPNAPYAYTTDGNAIALETTALGFDQDALAILMALHAKIMASGEYRKNHNIDMGRYVALLLGSSAHYYALTGVPRQLDTLLREYDLTDEKGYVDHSAVSLEHRIIRFSAQQQLRQLFVASEVDSMSGKVYEYETIEMMPNGQLRYAIFDSDGRRADSANPAHSGAGKPSKCMWCHESIIQPLFTRQQDHTGFLTYLDFKQKLERENQGYHEQKIRLEAGVDFRKKQQHTQTELLYIAFMEPSAQRLSCEWDMTVAEVLQRLSGLPTHVHEEFDFLGELYDRNDVEPFAPFKGLAVSGSVREASAIEVNHLD